MRRWTINSESTTDASLSISVAVEAFSQIRGRGERASRTPDTRAVRSTTLSGEMPLRESPLSLFCASSLFIHRMQSGTEARWCTPSPRRSCARKGTASDRRPMSVNQSKRMVKKSRCDGAHTVRTPDPHLGYSTTTLADDYRRWYPGFSHTDGRTRPHGLPRFVTGVEEQRNSH